MTEAVKRSHTSLDIPAESVPRWERRYRGRLRYELDALRAAGIAPDVDFDALKAGQLALTLDWPLDAGTVLRLRAVYPDAFPHIRPQVFLLSGLDPAPARHRSPMEGNLCLLGRDSRQWMPSWTLFKLLAEQLEKAVRGGGEEDPQGEPAEYWWNGLNKSGSFCLVDSAWDLGGAREGMLLVRYVPDGLKTEERGGETTRVPVLRAFVSEVRARDNTVLHRWDGPKWWSRAASAPCCRARRSRARSSAACRIRCVPVRSPQELRRLRLPRPTPVSGAVVPRREPGGRCRWPQPDKPGAP